MRLLIRVTIWCCFILFTATSILVMAGFYKGYLDYNNVKVTETLCNVTNYNIILSTCGVKPAYSCYLGYLILNLTTINENFISILYTYSENYDNVLNMMQNSYPIANYTTCYYQNDNPSIVTLSHDPHKPVEAALIAGIVFLVLTGLTLLLGIGMEIIWCFQS